MRTGCYKSLCDTIGSYIYIFHKKISTSKTFIYFNSIIFVCFGKSSSLLILLKLVDDRFIKVY
ncbi:unnamed protein product [Nezara viridula]|uniref:Uncharacterized protein n=1 Tax=Nezara viridula TaxID=85310 RepID=A0A9P0HLF5_NEZVI|nr:unnamed protein product [Nezara viridula]